jgi:hypothetical protein
VAVVLVFGKLAVEVLEVIGLLYLENLLVEVAQQNLL